MDHGKLVEKLSVFFFLKFISLGVLNLIDKDCSISISTELNVNCHGVEIRAIHAWGHTHIHRPLDLIVSVVTTNIHVNDKSAWL